MRYLPKYIVNTIMAILASCGTVFCVISSFDIPVSAITVVLVAIIGSLICTSFFLWKKAILLLIPMILGIAGLCFLTDFFAPLAPTLTQVIHDILELFSSAYPNVSFAIPPAPEAQYLVNHTLLFSTLAFILSLWMAWGIGYNSCLISIAGTLPFLLLCVIINNTPPHAAPLVFMLTVWITVLLSRERPGEPPVMDAVRVSLVLLAVFLFLGIVGIVYPKADTKDQALPELIEEIVDRLPEPMQQLLDRDGARTAAEQLGADTSRTLDLTQQGTRDRKDTVMMEISTTKIGPVYLRGAAKDIYTGTSWESSDMASVADAVYSHTSIGTAFGSSNQAGIQIKNIHDDPDVLFTPYGYISCTSADDIMSDLRVTISEEDYVVYYWPGIRSLDIDADQGYVNESYDQYVMDTCLDLPAATKEALYDLALSYGYDPEMSTAETVAWVAEFIRESGVYKLDVSRQPVNYDFAVYFLTESNQGYCVHFATAAAAMYRALGIPARYASGYRVNVPSEGILVDVLDRDTHAWAEVYISGLGWIPVETTPGFGETSALPQVKHPEKVQEEDPSPSPEPAEPSPSSEPEPEQASPSPSEVAATPSSVPAPQQDTPTAPNGTVATGYSILRWIIPAAGVVLLLLLIMLLRHRILICRRRKAFRSKNTNQRVLNMWQYLERLTKWGAEIPRELEVLALKAKFSQHEISPEELSPYESAVYRIAATTEKSLTRRKHMRFKWLSCLDLTGKK